MYVGVNQASAMMRAPYSLFHTSPDARAVMFGLMREVLALAACEGIHVDRFMLYNESENTGSDIILPHIPFRRLHILQTGY